VKGERGSDGGETRENYFPHTTEPIRCKKPLTSVRGSRKI
jgi:hypothetical protein